MLRRIGSASQTRLFSESGRHQPEFERGQRHVRGRVSIHFDRAENVYADWPSAAAWCLPLGRFTTAGSVAWKKWSVAPFRFLRQVDHRRR